MAPTEVRELRSRIGRAIRKLREEEGISAQYLAKVIGVNQATISRIESGASSISAENLFFIAKSFNRPLSFFVGEQSPVVYNEEDILRAGLVHYGARHLKAKRTIELRDHYRNYEDLLNAALFEADDPRIAAALATTLYQQITLGKINPLRIVSSIRHEQLAQRLQTLLLLLRKALPSLKRPSRERKRVGHQIEALLKELKDKYPTLSSTDIGLKSSSAIGLFINESLGHE